MGTQKMQDILTWKLKTLEAQILDLKKQTGKPGPTFEAKTKKTKKKKKKGWGDLKTKTLGKQFKREVVKKVTSR